MLRDESDMQQYRHTSSNYTHEDKFNIMRWSLSGILTELQRNRLIHIDMAAHAKHKTKTSRTGSNFKTVRARIQIRRALSCYQ